MDAISVPWLRFVFGVDARVGNGCGWVEEAELERDFKLAAEKIVELDFSDRALSDRGVRLVFIGVEELVDAGVEAGDDGSFLVGEVVVGGPELT